MAEALKCYRDRCAVPVPLWGDGGCRAAYVNWMHRPSAKRKT